MTAQRQKRTQKCRKQLRRRKKTLRMLLWVLLILLLVTGIAFLIKSLTKEKEHPKQEDNVTEITLPDSSFAVQRKSPSVDAKSKRMYTTSRCALMSYPSGESEVLGVVKPYTVVIAWYENENDNWYFISWDDTDGNSGWIPSKYLKDCYEDSCTSGAVDIPLEFYYQDLVRNTIELCGLDIDEYFVYGIMYIESRFNSTKVSSVGARGIMQIMPSTWDMLYERFCNEYPNQISSIENDISNEGSNITLGIYCLKYIKETCGIDKVSEYQSKVLTSYNRGIAGANEYFLSNDTFISQYSEKVLEAAEYIRENHMIPN